MHTHPEVQIHKKQSHIQIHMQIQIQSQIKSQIQSQIQIQIDTPKGPNGTRVVIACSSNAQDNYNTPYPLKIQVCICMKMFIRVIQVASNLYSGIKQF